MRLAANSLLSNLGSIFPQGISLIYSLAYQLIICPPPQRASPLRERMLIEQLLGARDYSEAGGTTGSSQLLNNNPWPRVEGQRGKQMKKRQENFRQWKRAMKRMELGEVIVMRGQCGEGQGGLSGRMQ